MPEIREVRPEDAPALAALWQRVFGDPEAYAGAFLRLLPALGAGAAAFENGKLLGAAYIVTDLELVEPERTRRCGYLYAVGVAPEARGRGLGGRLSQEAAALGLTRGAQLLCTLPAEPSLYAWYERILGLHCALYRERRLLGSLPGPEPVPLTPEEYGRRREALLQGRPHLRPGAAALRVEDANCRTFGGGLYAVGEGLAAAYVDGGVTEVRELLGAPPEAAASLGAALKTDSVRLWTPAPQGRPYLTFAPAGVPADTVWNLAFD